MPRTARTVAPGFPYHVTQRGNHREPLFFSDADRLAYLKDLAEGAARYNMEIWAYCLMTNHVHLLVVPRRADSLARAIQLAHARHGRRIHRERQWTGHLWANRFYSCCLDGPHLWRAVRYVELNPVRAGLVERAEDWPWSSARAHAEAVAEVQTVANAQTGAGAQVGAGPQNVADAQAVADARSAAGAPDAQFVADAQVATNAQSVAVKQAAAGALLSPTSPFPGPVTDWPAWLAEGLSEEEIEHLRRHTRTGRPLGGDSFLDGLELLTGRVLRPGKRGRKKKEMARE